MPPQKMSYLLKIFTKTKKEIYQNVYVVVSVHSNFLCFVFIANMSERKRRMREIERERMRIMSYEFGYHTLT